MKKIIEKLFGSKQCVIISRAKNLKLAPSLALPHRRGNITISPLPLGEGRILNELASCKNSGEGAFTSAEVFSPCRKVKLNFGFTLAEVLITLGIIGVVAALVIPGVINNFKCLELKTRFKKADSIIQQAMKMTFMEVGIEQYKEIQSFHSNDMETMEHRYAHINEIWSAQFKNAKKMKWEGNNWTGYQQHAGCKDFFGNPAGSLYTSCGNHIGYLLPDGLFIEEVTYNSLYHTDEIFFDTNGPFKGPNAFGYDLFTIYADANNPNISVLCNPFLVHTGRVRNCYRFAQMDINPFDSSTGYWESLYKPESWWQKVYDKK